MNQTDIRLIKQSIIKHELIAIGFNGDHGTEDCPLCGMYFKDPGTYESYNEECAGCPIKAVGHRGCYDTPYFDIPMIIRRNHTTIPNSPFIWDFCVAIEAEIEFLINLLPEKERGAYAII